MYESNPAIQEVQVLCQPKKLSSAKTITSGGGGAKTLKKAPIFHQSVLTGVVSAATSGTSAIGGGLMARCLEKRRSHVPGTTSVRSV